MISDETEKRPHAVVHERGRAGDDSFITVNRNIPIWALLTALVAIVATGVSLNFEVRDQVKKTQELSSQVAQLNANYTAEISGKVKMQLTVESLQQRVATLEAKK